MGRGDGGVDDSEICNDLKKVFLERGQRLAACRLSRAQAPSALKTALSEFTRKAYGPHIRAYSFTSLLRAI